MKNRLFVFKKDYLISRKLDDEYDMGKSINQKDVKVYIKFFVLFCF